MKIYLGLMSGTSMDGIDAALVDVGTHQLIAGMTKPYTAAVHDQMQAILDAETVSLSELWHLHARLGKEFASAANNLLKESGYSAKMVQGIGSHGQTIRHDALATHPYTIQLACPHTIAEDTGITVVADFRTRDIVVGGQGAPFAPLYHEVLFSSQNRVCAVVNIGGISNISVLKPHQKTIGYDLGPGNCLLDAWIAMQLGLSYDKDGAYAAKGQIISELLQAILSDPYFSLPYPKSICKSYFSVTWLQKWLKAYYAPQDVQATLLALTVACIAEAIRANHPDVQDMVLCGGGVHNVTLLKHLRSALPEINLLDTQEVLGINPDYLEAMMFAWLAHQTMAGVPLDLRDITGAKKPAILGAVYPFS